MPSPIAVIDLIKTAMRLKGIIATGETPTADEITDGVRALNDVLEMWSTESYAVWGGSLQTFNTVAGQSTYTLGPGGNWNSDRPISLNHGYTSWQGSDFPMKAWTLAEYMGVAVKTIRSQIPERFVFINDAPLASVILYPVPSQAMPITFDVPRILTQVAGPATVMTLPPGYARALQYAVAEELGPQYGSPIDLGGAARASLAYIKRANRQSPIAAFDSTLLAGRTGPWGSFYS